MARFVAALALAAGVVLGSPPLPVLGEELADFDLSAGHFFTQTNGSPLGPRGGGYLVSDDEGIPFWSFFTKIGGPDVLGYPVSRRFLWDGHVCQATQRGILQWNPSTGQVQLANVFDYLSAVGKDDWLVAAHLAPRSRQTPEEVLPANQPLSFLMLAHYRFAWLYQDPPIFRRYFSTPGYYTVYGLPTSPVEDLGPYLAVRFQRVVMYHWKTKVPWADANGVSVGLAGDLFKEVGLIPGEALRVEDGRGLGASGPLPVAPPRPATMAAQLPAPPAAPKAALAPNRASQLPVLTGVATWYGAAFQGSRMADGRPYDMYDPTTTAANAYPLGTWLRITRLTTGKSITVQVTDRGAFRYPNIVDLSYAAFAQLADPSMGVIGVRVEPIEPGA